ncbi:MAG: hypothetical protein ACLTKQ_06080 [Acutalibacteraceae bacterium]|jgi:hypothetical protein
MYKPISTYTGRHFDPYHAVAAEFLHFTGEVIPTNAPPLQRTPDWTQLPFDRVEQDFLHLYACLRG